MIARMYLVVQLFSSEDPFRFSKAHDVSIDKLFTAQEELYVTGARNFLFIDVPPVQRTPAGKPISIYLRPVHYLL